MKNRYLKFPTLILLVCFGLTTILPTAALAQPGHKPAPWGGPPPEGRGGHDPERNQGPERSQGPQRSQGPERRQGPEIKHAPVGKHGPDFRHVPPGGQKVRHKGDDYFFHSGRFYRHGPDGYFGVRPPLGIIAYSLPAAAVMVLIGGLTYYVYDNIYYRRVPAGYQVVEVPTQTTTIVHTPPSVPVNPADSGMQVVVTAKILNVRSGPGINHPVLTETYMGNVLIIQGSSSDWYYVRLPDNTYGWVMKAFVTMPGNRPQG